MKPEIIFENAEFIAFNKPSGLLTIPDRHNPNLPNLAHLAAEICPGTMITHRLDKDTSGAVCLAKSEESHRYLSGLFMNREVHKEYLAIVYGVPQKEKETIDLAILPDPSNKGLMKISPKGKPAITHYELVKSWKGFSLLKVIIDTGRTHQIRVHLRHLGYPIVCDSFYGDGKPFLLSSVKRKYKLSKWVEEEKPLLDHMALHSGKIIFTDSHQQQIKIEAPLPKQMTAMMKQLDKWDQA